MYQTRFLKSYRVILWCRVVFHFSFFPSASSTALQPRASQWRSVVLESNSVFGPGRLYVLACQLPDLSGFHVPLRNDSVSLGIVKIFLIFSSEGPGIRPAQSVSHFRASRSRQERKP